MLSDHQKMFPPTWLPHNEDQSQFHSISVQVSSVATRSSHICLWCCETGHCEIKDDCWNRMVFYQLSVSLKDLL